MGNGMNKILPGLYVGNIKDAQAKSGLEEHNITHILAIHDNAKAIHSDKTYLCITASDNASQDLIQHFPQCIAFIHKARVEGGNVLVHCLAGMSRSVTVTAAYIMTVTQYGWRDSLNAVRGARRVANPNFGFQRQLQTYEHELVDEARTKFKEENGNNPFSDEKECKRLLEIHRRWVLTGEDNLYPLPHNAYGIKDKLPTGGAPSTQPTGGTAEETAEQTDNAAGNAQPTES